MNAEKAIEILDEHTTDIAILDINLNGKYNGIWLAEQTKEKYNIPFIFLSAYSGRETIETASELKPLMLVIIRVRHTVAQLP